ncbi:MAG: adenosine deaminase [Aggregatilineales bacterium]
MGVPQQQVSTPDALRVAVDALPKIELHRHLEGSVRLETLVDIARQYIEMPEYDIETLRPFVQVMPEEVHNPQHFLAKFQTLRQFYRSREAIERITREAVEDAAADNIFYMELRFTPMALCKSSGCTIDEVVVLVCETALAAAKDTGIEVNLITSMNRHESVDIGEVVLESTLKHLDMGIVGIDLAGAEANFSALPFRAVFQKAKAAGLGITIHAGEWAGAGSVWDAVGNLGATRVGHGIKILEDLAMLEMVIERGIVLEVCPGSNVLSGIVPKMSAHPIRELSEYGVLTTINTDDPSVCNITLSDEMYSVMTAFDMSIDDLNAATLRAANAAFLSPDARELLIKRFHELLSTTIE